MDHLLELDTCIILSSERTPAAAAAPFLLYLQYISSKYDHIYSYDLYSITSPKSHIKRPPWTNKFSLLYEERSCENDKLNF